MVVNNNNVEMPQEIEKGTIKSERKNPILNILTLNTNLLKERRDRRDWEHIDNDTTEIHTLMPDLLESTSIIDTGILDIESVKGNALLGYEGIEKLPDELRYQRYQNIHIYGRIVQSDYLEWFEKKKVLDDDDYVYLVDDLNDDEQGITFAELSKLTGKSVIDIINIFKRCNGFISLQYTPVYKEMVMYDDFYVRLIPILDVNNRLERIEYQYLLKAKAIETFINYK